MQLTPQILEHVSVVIYVLARFDSNFAAYHSSQCETKRAG
jgi:hypothetical protein